jgi:hypothetical protein
MTETEHLEALQASIREQCEAIAGGGLIGPSTAHFETAPDAQGQTHRFIYVTQCSGKIKDEGKSIANCEDPTADVDAAANQFVAGFREIDSARRKPGEGVVWRITPRFVKDDSGLFYFRARYIFAPACSIAYPDADGNVARIEEFGGGN